MRQLTPDRVTKTLTVEDGTLVACVHPSRPGPPNLSDASLIPSSRSARSAFSAADLRTLRAALSAFLDLLALCSRTLETFPSRP